MIYNENKFIFWGGVEPLPGYDIEKVMQKLLENSDRNFVCSLTLRH